MRTTWGLLAIALLLPPLHAARAEKPMTLDVDAREVARRIVHAHLVVPARPGKLTLLYPQWIPGEHGPTGPIADLAIVSVTARGKPIAWKRDTESMFAFHLEVPAGADAVAIDLDYLANAETDDFGGVASGTSDQVAVVSWNQLLLYPQGAKAAELKVTPSLRLPAGWRFGTSLAARREAGGRVDFETVSLEMLVDAPVNMGAHVKVVPLDKDPAVRMVLAADSEAALDLAPELAQRFAKLMKAALALFGARHFRGYTFLVTLSDAIAHFGLEHHESSDNRAPERALTEDDHLYVWAGLLPHELTHSWNGKYRRPAGLTQPSFAEPHRGELLWVYEGLTEYLGDVLTARSGLYDAEQFREMLAFVAARMEVQGGRRWRPLVDTAVAAQILYGSRDEWAAWRRGTDFYPEGELLWLEVDATIRKLAPGKSLDDFCRAFHGGESGPPKVVPYRYEDVITTLGKVAPYDWAGFFQKRVEEPRQKAPLEGLTASGWRLVYSDKPNRLIKSNEEVDELADQRFSIGLRVEESGRIPDIVPGFPADRAGVAPGMKLLAVNGRKWSRERLREAVRESKTRKRPIELVLENGGDYVKTVKLDYAGGERYPHLERLGSAPDLLTKIISF